MYLFSLRVAPLAGAWIEMWRTIRSLMRVSVAPLAGAWIEIFSPLIYSTTASVAPLAGAWIEMQLHGQNGNLLKRSLPLRERGLK